MEQGSNMSRTTEGKEQNSGPVSGIDTAFNEEFEKARGVAPKNARGGKPPPKQSVDKSPLQVLADTILSEIGTIHRLWDKQKRQIAVCQDKATACDYIAPKVVDELQGFVHSADQIDEQLASKERLVKISHKNVNQDEMDLVRKRAEDMKDIIERSKSLIKKLNKVMSDD